MGICGFVSSFDDEINDILDIIDEKLTEAQKDDWVKRVHRLHKMISPLLVQGIITIQDKNYFRREISSLIEVSKTLNIDEELVNTLITLQSRIEKLKNRKNAEKILDEQGKSISAVESDEDYTQDIERMLLKEESGVISQENIRMARNVLMSKRKSTTHSIVRYIVSLNLMWEARKKKNSYTINHKDIFACILDLIEKNENKNPELSIFIQGDATFFDVAGIQVSFWKVPHTEKTKSIITSRNNRTNENKYLKLYRYADELFNLVFKRNQNV